MLPQPHQTKEQQIEHGKALKRVVKRSEHRHIGRVDRDPVALLAGTDAGRVERLVPLKYGRMLASPFAFFRGSAVLQAHDLATTPHMGVQHTICGDAPEAELIAAAPDVVARSGSRRTRGSAYERASGGSSGGQSVIGQADARAHCAHRPGARFSPCHREKP